MPAAGLDGKHGGCPGAVGPAQEARLSDKVDRFLPRPDQSSAQHILELVAWRQPWSPSVGTHAPRRCRASDREATGSMIFDFLNNEKCTCRSDHTAGATGGRPCLLDGCPVSNLVPESRAMAGHGGRGCTWGSQEAGSGEVRGAGGGGVHGPGPLGLVGLAEQCPAGREARRLLPVTCSLDRHLLA